jgi:hypothetical protein
MDRLLDWWTAYQGWASNLDSEGRFYIIAGSLLLLGIYAAIDSFPANSGKEPANSAKTNKTWGNDRRR